MEAKGIMWRKKEKERVTRGGGVCEENKEEERRSDRGHGDDHPVEGRGDGGEARALVYLDEVAEAGLRGGGRGGRRGRRRRGRALKMGRRSHLAKMKPLITTRKTRRASSL